MCESDDKSANKGPQRGREMLGNSLRTYGAGRAVLGRRTGIARQKIAPPYPKPVELFANPMLFHTGKDDICHEPFSGSGTSLCAAEKTGRRRLAMDLPLVSPLARSNACPKWV